jgi:hypothetical protein
MDASVLTNVMKYRLIALIAEFSPPAQKTFLLHQAGLAIGRIDFEAYRFESMTASVSLDGDEIAFHCAQGIHGRLYPDFELDELSLTRTATGQVVDLTAALKTLRVAFRHADDVKISDDREEPDEETFIVDPDTHDNLIESHLT